jgi:hypothetical protein
LSNEKEPMKEGLGRDAARSDVAIVMDPSEKGRRKSGLPVRGMGASGYANPPSVLMGMDEVDMVSDRVSLCLRKDSTDMVRKSDHQR